MNRLYKRRIDALLHILTGKRNPLLTLTKMKPEDKIEELKEIAIKGLAKKVANIQDTSPI